MLRCVGTFTHEYIIMDPDGKGRWRLGLTPIRHSPDSCPFFGPKETGDCLAKCCAEYDEKDRPCLKRQREREKGK